MFFDRLKNPPDHSGGFFSLGGGVFYILAVTREEKQAKEKRKSRVKICPLPPLCKGRWVGVSRAGGIVPQNLHQASFTGESATDTAADNPSVSLRPTAPPEGAPRGCTAVSHPVYSHRRVAA